MYRFFIQVVYHRVVFVAITGGAPLAIVKKYIENQKTVEER